MTDFVKDQYMTLKANDKYKGDLKAAIPTVTIRWNGDPMGQVQALQNGEVDLISPQSTADVLDRPQGDQGREGRDEPTRPPTSTSTCSSPTAARSTRPPTVATPPRPSRCARPSCKTIPRQEIVDKLIKPLNPNAVLRESFTVVPGSPNYDSVVAANGQKAYDTVDIQGAKDLLAAAGVTTPVQVRLLFAPDNPRRQNEYSLIAASAKEAGFDVVPYQVQTDWGTDLSNATSYYDAALFGWQSTSTAVTESDANYRTGGGEQLLRLLEPGG